MKTKTAWSYLKPQDDIVLISGKLHQPSGHLLKAHQDKPTISKAIRSRGY